MGAGTGSLPWWVRRAMWIGEGGASAFGATLQHFRGASTANAGSTGTTSGASWLHGAGTLVPPRGFCAVCAQQCPSTGRRPRCQLRGPPAAMLLHGSNADPESESGGGGRASSSGSGDSSGVVSATSFVSSVFSFQNNAKARAAASASANAAQQDVEVRS
jgi:hypothetical protein